MTCSRNAIYPGSFDPITLGHLDIIRRASSLFDKVIVGVLDNKEKSPLFSVAERIDLIKKCVADMPNIECTSFNGLLVDFAKSNNITSVVRGLRVVSDFDYEFQMAVTNRELMPEIETVFLMTDKNYAFLSSSLVRQISQFHGNIATLVPPPVLSALEQKFGGSN